MLVIALPAPLWQINSASRWPQQCRRADKWADKAGRLVLIDAPSLTAKFLWHTPLISLCQGHYYEKALLTAVKSCIILATGVLWDSHCYLPTPWGKNISAKRSIWDQYYKTFYICNLQISVITRVFVPYRHFQPSLVIARKAEAYLSETLLGVLLWGRTLD